MAQQRKQQNRELFNDGIVHICKTDKRSIVEDITMLRFGLRTVGVTRFYQAKIADSTVDKLISIPKNNLINLKNIAIINNVQYEIKQVQEKYDTVPPSMYLTLQKAVPEYKDERSKSDESN